MAGRGLGFQREEEEIAGFSAKEEEVNAGILTLSVWVTKKRWLRRG